jgi:hypothetical protein
MRIPERTMTEDRVRRFTEVSRFANVAITIRAMGRVGENRRTDNNLGPERKRRAVLCAKCVAASATPPTDAMKESRGEGGLRKLGRCGFRLEKTDMFR